MKKHRILAIVSYIVIVIGIGALGYNGFIADSSGTSSMTIPAGEGYFAAFYTKSSMWINAHIEGTIEVDGAGGLDMFVLDSTQYDEYSFDLSPASSLWSAHGSAGSFSIDLPGSGRYYVVANHDSDSSSVAQTVTLSYKITGIDMLYVIIGAVVMAVGIALAYVSFRMRKKDEAATPVPSSSPTTEVKMFDSKQKLQ